MSSTEDYKKFTEEQAGSNSSLECVKNIVSMWKTFTGKTIHLSTDNTGNKNQSNTTRNEEAKTRNEEEEEEEEAKTRSKAWRWILENPDLAYKDCRFNENGVKYEIDISKYGADLTGIIKKLLKYITLDDVQLDRDKLTINGETVSKKGYGVIAGARRLQSLKMYSKEILPFYRSEKWRDYIAETCGRISLLGFPKDRYPLTTQLYIQPCFIGQASNNTEKKAVTFDEIKDYLKIGKRKVLIVGTSGIGKTSCLKHLAVLCYKQEICQGYIPIFLSLRRAAFLETQLPNQFFQTLLDVYLFTLNDIWGAKITKDEVTEVLRQGKALILIDGLDIDHRNSFYNIRQVQDFIYSFPKNNFVISSKGLDFLEDSFLNLNQDFSGERIKKYEIKGFNRKSASELIKKYFDYSQEKPSSDKTTVERNLSDDEVKTILDNYPDSSEYIPLLLICLCCYCSLVKHTEKSENTVNTNYPGDFNSTELIGRAVNKFISNWDANRNSDPSDPYSLLPPKERINLLGFLAVRFIQGDSNQGNLAHISVNKDSAIRWLTDYVNQPYFKEFLYEKYLIFGDSQSIKNNHFEQLAEHILSTIESQHGLIIERFTGYREILFIHSRIQKYLAAVYLSQIGLTKLDEFLSFKGDWIEIVQQALKLIVSKNETNEMNEISTPLQDSASKKMISSSNDLLKDEKLGSKRTLEKSEKE